MIDFSLYLQSSYSFNGSVLDIETAVKRAKELGYHTLGLTDSNKTHGLLKFYKSCLNHGIKPLLGLEVIIKSEKYPDMIALLYVKNNKGYHNLLKISSQIATRDGYLELHQIRDFNEGLIFVPVLDRGGLYLVIRNKQFDILNGLITDLERSVNDYYLGFGSNIFSDNQLYEELSVNYQLVIVNPVLYLDEFDKEASIVLKKILRNDQQEKGIFEESEKTFSLLDMDRLKNIFSQFPDAIKNTNKLIESTDIKIDFKQRYLPNYPLEQGTSLEKLKQLTFKGLERRLYQKGIYDRAIQDYKERLIHELNIIEEMHYEDYFLIVWDFVLYAKKQGILVGPGRGSAAGSLISYVLGITEVDPLEFDLYFERFLNPERITMPDIDMDFPDNKRDDIIRYVVDKYGIDKVASIITFGTFQGKSAIRDVGRILETSSTIIDDLTKKISLSNNSIETFEKEHPKDYKYYMNNPEINRLMTIAKKISGLVRHVSTHAAGIIISNKSMTEYSAIQPGLLDMHQTQFEASDLESLGLLKIDFLGIRNLTIIEDVLSLIEKNERKKINVYKLPLDDKKTFQLLKDVKTLGIFQLESEGMMNLMRQMKLDNFEDIATCISLHRPGPMENIPLYIRRRNKEEGIDYLDKDLIPILKPTNGIIIYQEQIMKIANKFAGYSLGEADVLRRAVSKKSKSILVKERKKFVSRVKKQGYSEVFGEKIYDYIVKFANYGFNKSHAVAYSYVAYWMAYLKANYPSYFLAVLLDFQIGSITGTKKYIREANSMGIDVLPPKINRSGVSYIYEDKGLRYPYMAIKGIGHIMAEKIVEIQDESEVTSFIDFYSRGNHLPKNVIESLIHANVFSDFGVNKQTLIENLDRVEAFISFHYNDESFHYIEYDEYDYQKMEYKERDLLGINFEYHLIHSYDKMIKNNHLQVLSDIIGKRLGYVKFVALISKVRVIKTKNNDQMAFVTLEDEFTEVDGVLFPGQYEKLEHLLKENQVYFFDGKTDIRHDHLQVIVDNIKILKR
ncbi:DNA polymerase III subunit alpha [Mycoplasmatota bacterium]|nr:DNA polymerase III subunit alpha [Mycoplasmatota bacterium]